MDKRQCEKMDFVVQATIANDIKRNRGFSRVVIDSWEEEE